MCRVSAALSCGFLWLRIVGLPVGRRRRWFGNVHVLFLACGTIRECRPLRRLRCFGRPPFGSRPACSCNRRSTSTAAVDLKSWWVRVDSQRGVARHIWLHFLQLHRCARLPSTRRGWHVGGSSPQSAPRAHCLLHCSPVVSRGVGWHPPTTLVRSSTSCGHVPGLPVASSGSPNGLRGVGAGDVAVAGDVHCS